MSAEEVRERALDFHSSNRGAWVETLRSAGTPSQWKLIAEQLLTAAGTLRSAEVGQQLNELARSILDAE